MKKGKNETLNIESGLMQIIFNFTVPVLFLLTKTMKNHFRFQLKSAKANTEAKIHVMPLLKR